MAKKIKVCKKIENGEAVRAEYFTIEGKIEKKEDYREGKLIRIETFTYEKQYTLWEAFNAERILIGKRETWYNEYNQIEKEDSGFGIEKYYYDDNHRLLYLKEFDLQNNPQMTLEYSYVENGEYRKCFDSSGTLQTLDITRYNDAKKISRITSFKRPDQEPINPELPSGFEEFFEMMKAFNFDINGNETNALLSMDFLIEDNLYEYDKSENEVLHEEYGYYKDCSVNVLRLVNGNYNVYDQNNLLVKNDYHQIRTDWDAKDQIFFKYVLNENGLIIEKMTNSGVNKIIESFNYNKKGKLTSYSENRNDFEEITEVLYNQYGNKISKMRKCNYDGEYEQEITKYEIEYY